MLSIWSSIARGNWGVGVIVGVSVTDGVSVMVGVSVIVGVTVMEGVMVTVGVWDAVGVGGKKLYATGSANWFKTNARIPKNRANMINLQPRTMRSRLMRKKRRVRAFRIARIPSHRLSTSPRTARTMAAWTAAWISNERESKSKGRFTISEQVR